MILTGPFFFKNDSPFTFFLCHRRQGILVVPAEKQDTRVAMCCLAHPRFRATCFRPRLTHTADPTVPKLRKKPVSSMLWMYVAPKFGRMRASLREVLKKESISSVVNLAVARWLSAEAFSLRSLCACSKKEPTPFSETCNSRAT